MILLHNITITHRLANELLLGQRHRPCYGLIMGSATPEKMRQLRARFREIISPRKHGPFRADRTETWRARRGEFSSLFLLPTTSSTTTKETQNKISATIQLKRVQKMQRRPKMKMCFRVPNHKEIPFGATEKGTRSRRKLLKGKLAS